MGTISDKEPAAKELEVTHDNRFELGTIYFFTLTVYYMHGRMVNRNACFLRVCLLQS
jgi:hypothetical protein